MFFLKFIFKGASVRITMFPEGFDEQVPFSGSLELKENFSLFGGDDIDDFLLELVFVSFGKILG
jgi:hypothetical protein